MLTQPQSLTVCMCEVVLKCALFYSMVYDTYSFGEDVLTVFSPNNVHHTAFCVISSSRQAHDLIPLLMTLFFVTVRFSVTHELCVNAAYIKARQAKSWKECHHTCCHTSSF